MATERALCIEQPQRDKFLLVHSARAGNISYHFLCIFCVYLLEKEIYWEAKMLHMLDLLRAQNEIQ